MARSTRVAVGRDSAAVVDRVDQLLEVAELGLAADDRVRSCGHRAHASGGQGRQS
jgi:hypothetical protein